MIAQTVDCWAVCSACLALELGLLKRVNGTEAETPHMLHSHSQPKCFAYGACHGSVWPNLAAHFGPIVHANVVVHSTSQGSVGEWEE